MHNTYDLVIIGSGPAGLSAGLYGSRAKLKTLILEKEKSGGQIAITNEVENYPGSVEHATGPSLTQRMVDQCETFGTAIVKDEIVECDLESRIKVIKGKKDTYQAKAVIIATGSNPRKIGCVGEAELTSKGVSYCATCDAGFFEDFEVFVVGGGDSAIEEAIYLTKFASKVTIVHRREGFRAAKSIIEKAQNNPKIEWMLNQVITEVRGEEILESIVFENTQTGEVSEYFANEDDGIMGLFVFIGQDAQTEIFKGKVDMDATNYIITDEEMRTKIAGVFAAGDCRAKSLRQVVTAAADGAIAAVNAEKYIEEFFE